MSHTIECYFDIGDKVLIDSCKEDEHEIIAEINDIHIGEHIGLCTLISYGVQCPYGHDHVGFMEEHLKEKNVSR